MNTQEIKAIDVQELASQYTELKHKTNGEYTGPCPICHDGVDRFVVSTQRNRWFCRKASETGHMSTGDAIDLVQQVEGVDFKAAINIIETMGFTKVHMKSAQVDEAHTFNEDGTWGWYNETMQSKLLSTSWAINYLNQRGLTVDTAMAAGLGAGFRDGVKSISIPYYDYANGKRVLVGGKFRTLGTGQRYFIWKSCSMVGKLYGWHLPARSGTNTVIVCEGELNCLSVHQAVGGQVKVLSTGSQTFNFTDDVIAQLGSYKHVYFWADEQSTLDKWLLALPRASGWISPIVDGVKYDANALLVQGSLVGGLQKKFKL